MRDDGGPADPKEPTRRSDKATRRTPDNEPSGNTPDNDVLLARLRTVMRCKHRLAERWNGSTAGLQDASRSGMDMSMTRLLKDCEFSYLETKSLLIQWQYGAGIDHAEDDRYFRRMWGRCGLVNPAEGHSNSFDRHDHLSDTESWPEPVDFRAR